MNKIKIGMVFGLALTMLILLGTFPMERVIADLPYDRAWMPGYDDYSPHGLPDFHQGRSGWNGYCAPVSAANILWYFDSKHETLEGPPPGPQPSNEDVYNLVNRSYYYDGIWHYTSDDHSEDVPYNLTESLASWEYCKHVDWLGITLDLLNGIKKWITNHGFTLGVDYNVYKVGPWLTTPSWDSIYDAVDEGIGVILGIGSDKYILGGHALTVQGAFKTSEYDYIVLSDPARNSEHPEYKWYHQDNASNVSYDTHFKYEPDCIYKIIDNPIPGHRVKFVIEHYRGSTYPSYGYVWEAIFVEDLS